MYKSGGKKKKTFKERTKTNGGFLSHSTTKMLPLMDEGTLFVAHTLRERQL